MKKSKTLKPKTLKSESENVSAKNNASAKNPASENFLIVGIGASAGGIQALKIFFENVAADSGAAYVVILHLSPDHESQLASVLQTVAAIPVTQVTERVRVEPNHVYVVPPNQSLSMADEHIVPSPVQTVEERRAPVDIFFRTLAETHGERNVAVILSGTGADGSMGIKRVKENGGAAFVQNPREAEFNEMPRNSIATDLIDLILNVAEIPAQIVAYGNNRGKTEFPFEAEKPPARETAKQPQEQALINIFTQLRVRTGHDFTNYKRATMLRRIERRINVHGLPNITAYADYLRENSDEAHALLKGLLISVTNFFRDRTSFLYLESEILPKVLSGKNSDGTIRVWVVGCATGEEAYSLAMFLAEQSEKAESAPAIQIFATDIDKASIAKAREGFYTLNDAADVSPERLKRFFTKETGGYRIRRELRDVILFAHHNVLKDPPFSRLDLITCRNMLIYLNTAAQERVMETFHFSLKAGSYLFLGNSETVDGASRLYAPVSREHHIYQSRQTAPRIGYPLPETLKQVIRFIEPNESGQVPENAAPTDARPLEKISYAGLHQQLLEEYTPSIIVSEDHDVVHMSESSLRFMQMTGGEPTQNLLKLIRPELRIELRTALYQAAQRRTNVEVKNVKITSGDREESVNISVRPVMRQTDTARGFILVLFDAVKESRGDDKTVYRSDEPVARQLEEELIRSKAQLRSSAEQYEVQAEEFKASNEELQALNEELRSSAEELETGKEELQSLNEELGTVNQELKIKVEEVSQTSNNLSNLINSTDIGTIFLDRLFRVDLFTPAAAEIFNLIPADIGRPLADIAHQLETTDLLDDARLVLEKLQTVEREVRSLENRDFMVRVLPYRTKDDKIGGVVITFYDITERKRAEEAVQLSEERLQKSINIETVGVLFFNNDIEITDCNDAFLRMSGYTRQELRAGRFSWKAFTPDEFAGVSSRAIEELNTTGITTPYEKEYVRKNGSKFWALFAAKRIGENEIVEFVTDITEQKRAEAAVRESKEQLRIALDASEMGTFRWYPQEDRSELDARMLTLLGLREGDTMTFATALAASIHPDDRELYAAAVAQSLDPNGDGKLDVDYRLVHPDESVHWLHIYGNTSFTRENPARARLMYGMVLDITERKRTEANLAFLAEVSQELVRLTNIDEAINALGAKIADYFNVARVFLAEIDDRARTVRVPLEWHKGGAPNLFVEEFYNLDDFISEEFYSAARAGEMIVVGDTRTDSRTTKDESYRMVDTRSFVTANFVRDGEWLLGLSLTDSEPREWRADETELIREITSRIWTRLERARAEELLAESEEEYRTLFTSIDEAFCTIEVLFNDQGKAVDYRFLETNPVFDRQTGLENVVGKTARECVPQLEEFWFETYGQVAKTGEATRFEDEAAALGRFYDVYAFRIGEAGENRVAVLFNDITERKQAEKNLRESEERFRAMFEQANVGIVQVDLGGHLIMPNPGFCEIIGYTAEECRGLNVRDITHPNDFKREEKLTRQLIKGKIPGFSIEKRYVRKNGAIVWGQMTTTVVRHQSDEPLYALAIVEDITGRKRIEEELRESEERLRLLIESASDYAIFTITIDKVINSWNAGAEKVFGWTESEAIGQSSAIIFTPEDREKGAHEQEVKIALLAGRAPDERFHIRKDGSRFYASGVMTVLKNDDSGAVQGFAKIARDMTEQIEAEKALRDREILQRLVGAQEDERRRIARDLHDELGQQLTALRLKLDVAKKMCDDEKLCEKIDEMEIVAKSIDNGVDFLAWELRPAALDDLGLIAALENYAKQWSQHSGVTAELFAVNLKKTRFSSEIETNLYRIVQEALNNTHKHAGAQSVEIVLENRGGLIALLIADDGAGFDPKDKKSLHKGLGLTGMRERAALIGGTLEIESAPRKGTTIFVRVPTATAKRRSNDAE